MDRYNIIYNRIVGNLLPIVILIVIIGFIQFANAQSQNIEEDPDIINLNLQYKSDSLFDIDNDGSETATGVIDFTVENTLFNLDYQIIQEKLCTRWSINSIDNDESTTVCYGNENCCNFISLIPTRSGWNEPFYLTYGLYGASDSNIVSAQVIHVDYDIDSIPPYSNIYNSDLESLPADFLEQELLPEIQNSVINFPDNSTITLNISSPDNSSPLTDGYEIYLNYSTSLTVNSRYSLDNSEFIDLPQGTSFFDKLNGTLPYNIISNGNHQINIYLEDLNQNNGTVIHNFNVNDVTPPKIEVDFENNSEVSGTYLEMQLNISSDEHALISYSLNGNIFSEQIDLGADKAKLFDIIPINGLNTLIINSTDFHNNSILSHFSFTFIELGTCDDTRQNGLETGIDCGGNCISCIDFGMSLDKFTFDSDETVWLSSEYRANSIVNLTVSLNNEISYRYQFPVSSGNVVGMISIQNSTTPGIYTINALMQYINITENKTLTFERLQPEIQEISVSISANKSTIIEGEDVKFSSTITGSTGTISYNWDFDNDGIIDSNSASPVKKFESNRTYLVNLSVSDDISSSTATKTITVNKLYAVTFRIFNNETSIYVDDAIVEYGDVTKNSSSDGRVAFSKIKGDYKLLIKKKGYKTLSDNVEVTGTLEYPVNLTTDDEKSPIIQLIAPPNDQVIENSNVSFRYKSSDKSDMSCRLYISGINSSFTSPTYTNSTVINDIESAYIIDLNPGHYKWKVDCTDRNGNLNSSEVFTFNVGEEIIVNDLSVDLNDQDKIAQDIILQIKDTISSLETMSTKEIEAASDLNLKKKLEKSIALIERANRDINSLKWRRLNETGLEEETQRILDSVEDVKQTTPRNLEVIDSTEFVKYPAKEDVRAAIKMQLSKTNKRFSDRDIDKLVDENIKLQSLLTVTTTSKIVSLEYISGDKETITIIKKSIIASDNLPASRYYEIVPKDIAEDIEELVFLFDHEVIERDPVIEIDLDKILNYVYYIKKRITLEETENIKSILLKDELEVEKKSFITGLSVIDNFTSKLVRTSDTRLIIEIAIIIILAAVYLTYSFGGFEKIVSLVNHKDLKEIELLIIKANENIVKNDYANASATYKEINQKFNILDSHKKSKLKSSVIETANKVNLLYVNKLVDEAISLIPTNKKSALSNYQKIHSLYKIFPKQYKSEVSKKCIQLHNILKAS